MSSPEWRVASLIVLPSKDIPLPARTMTHHCCMTWRYVRTKLLTLVTLAALAPPDMVRSSSLDSCVRLQERRVTSEFIYLLGGYVSPRTGNFRICLLSFKHGKHIAPPGFTAKTEVIRIIID